MSENHFAEPGSETGNGTEINSEADEILHRKEFGQPLKQARVQRGLSINEVSTELRLTEKIIHALEESAVEQLPTAIFTRGYIRAYARLLELPPGDLVKKYMQISPLNEPELAQRPRTLSESSHGTRSIQLITLAIVFGFILLLAQWVVDRPKTGSEVVSVLSTVDSASDMGAIIEHPEEGDIQATSMPVEVPEVIAADTPTLSEQIQTDITINELTDSTGEDRLNESPSTEAAGTGGDVLKILSRSESWVEVDGANIRGLYYGLMDVNEIATIEGTAPFNVFLGNAPDVSVFINSFPVDLSSFIRLNKIAHFQIGMKSGQPELGRPVVVEIREKTVDIEQGNNEPTDESYWDEQE